MWPRFAFLCVALLGLLALETQVHAETAAKKCRYVNLKTLPIAFADRMPTVEGSVNGKATTMLIGTGAYQTALTRSGAEDLGLKIGHSSRLAYGVSGESEMYRARVDELSIGPVKRGGTTLMVLWNFAGKRPYGAVVGADFLFQRDLEISMADRKLTFFHPIDCEEAFLAYWDVNAFVADFGPAGAPGDPPHVVVKINGQNVRAIIDTGAAYSMLDLAAAERAGITPQSAGVVEGAVALGLGPHPVPTWIAPFESVAIGNATMNNVKLAIMDMWGAAEASIGYRPHSLWLRDGAEMLLGVDFLQSHRVLLAMSQRRLYFSYLGGDVFDITSRPTPATPAPN